MARGRQKNEEFPSDEEVKELLDSKTAEMTEKEFCEEVDKLPDADEAAVLEAFQVFDQNGNGFIPISDLMHVLSELGEGLDAKYIEELKKDAEPDEEGQVNIRVLVTKLLKTV